MEVCVTAVSWDVYVVIHRAEGMRGQQQVRLAVVLEAPTMQLAGFLELNMGQGWPLRRLPPACDVQAGWDDVL